MTHHDIEISIISFDRNFVAVRVDTDRSFICFFHDLYFQYVSLHTWHPPLATSAEKIIMLILDETTYQKFSRFNHGTIIRAACKKILL